jgi:hypothetical protein
MSTFIRMKTFSYFLAAGSAVTAPRGGQYVRGMSGDYPYQLRFDDGEISDFETGIGGRTRSPFVKVEIINSSAFDQTIRLLIADDTVDDNRLVGNVDISGGIKIAGATSTILTSAVPFSNAVLVSAASSTRANCFMQNVGQNTVYLGPTAAVTGVDGIKLIPSASFSWDAQGDIYVYCISLGLLRTLENSL